jgi:MarR family transcriptional regulator, lower aerobic nicotinate degradation pathway regulator
MGNDTLARLEKLVGEYRRFCERAPAGEHWLRDFGAWLQQAGREPEAGEHAGLGESDTLIGMFLITVNNLTRSRMNKLISGTPFSNIMDYHFLILLGGHGRQRKSDLIASNHMEMSSGIEVIRRLLKNGWILEEPNPEDRRSKYVSISSEGKRLIAKLQPQIDDFYRSFCAGLNTIEKAEVLRTLELLTTRI